MPLVFLAAEGSGVGLSHVAFMIVIALVAIMSPFVIRKTWRRSKTVDRSELKRQAEAEVAARRSADKALLDLLEASREISAQIDTKIRILNKLTKDSDKQARRLEKLLGIAIETDAPVSPQEGQGASQTTDPTDKSAGGDVGAESTVVENTATDNEAPQEDVIARTSSGRWRSTVHERIEKLHDSGLVPADIARRTGLSRQEVDLVIHLLAADKKS